MEIARQRVVPVAPRPAWLCYAGLGVALGAPAAPLVYFGAYLLMQKAQSEANFHDSRVWAGLWMTLAVSIGISPLYVLPALFRVTQKWGAVLGFAAGFIGAMWLVLEGAKVLSRGDGGAAVSAWLSGPLLGLAAVEIGGYVALAAALLGVYRIFVVRAIEHDPGDCAWCGYTRGSPSITRCPECGRPAAPPSFHEHRFVTGVTALARRGPWLGAIAVAALVIIAAVPIWNRTIPALRFYARFAGAQRVPPWAWMVSGSALSAGGTYEIPGVWMPIPGRTDGGGVYVLYAPGLTGRGSRMWVGISGEPSTGLSMGSTRIVSDLTDTQAAHVLSHGLPDPLIQALSARADELAWTISSVPRGGSNLDATPYFPIEAAKKSN